MKKIMTLMLGLGLILGTTATVGFAQEKKDEKKEEGKKNGGKKGKKDEKKEEKK
jgi:hypothetical protein